jgi:long-subunit fatty acid transport protein
MQERSTHGWLIPAAGSLALVPAVAGASGFALLEQSASRLGTAFAGTHWEMDFGYAHLFSDTVPLDQDAESVAASALLNGQQHSDVDIVSAQLVYRF